MYWIFSIGGYLAAILTAFYSFRIVFRVVYGEPCKEARELEAGHLAHAEPANPATGEAEDTDVGFPGPEHHIAERAWPMRVAMGALGVLALIGGALQIPGVTDVISTFFEGTFGDSTIENSVEVSRRSPTSACWSAASAHPRDRRGLLPLHRGPGIDPAAARPGAAAPRLPLPKWYFDELLDALVYRPWSRRALRQRHL